MVILYLPLRLENHPASLISVLSLNLMLILFRLDSWWKKISLLFSHVFVLLLRIWRLGMWSPRVVKLGECSNCPCVKHLMMHIICLPVKKTSITQINCGTYDIIILDIHMLKNILPCNNIIFIWLRNHGVYRQYCLVKNCAKSKSHNLPFLVVLFNTTLLLIWFTMMYGVLN